MTSEGGIVGKSSCAEAYRVGRSFGLGTALVLPKLLGGLSQRDVVCRARGFRALATQNGPDL
jgi:hypothetical protein